MKKKFLKNFYLLLLIYSAIYFWYPYYFPWAEPDLPTAPLFVLLSRDVLFVVFLLLSIVIWGIPLPRKNRLLIYFYSILLLILIFSLPSAPDNGSTDYLHHFLRNTLMYFFAVPTFVKLFSTCPKLYATTFKFFVFNSIVQSFFGFLLINFLPLDKSLWGGGRLYALMGNPNTLGLFLAFANTLLFSTILVEIGKISRSIGVIALLIVLLSVNSVALIETLSIEAVLAQFVMVFIAAFLLFDRKNTVFIVAGLSILLGFFTILVLVSNNFIDLLLFRIYSPEATSVSGRIAQAKEVLGIISDPLVWLIGNYRASSFILFDSQYYNLIVNNGMFIFVLYLALLSFPLVFSYASIRHKYYPEIPVKRALTASAFAFVATLLFISNLTTAFAQRYPINLYLAILVAILICEHSSVPMLMFPAKTGYRSEPAKRSQGAE